MGSLLTFVNAVADRVADQHPAGEDRHVVLLVLAPAASDHPSACQCADSALQH